MKWIIYIALSIGFIIGLGLSSGPKRDKRFKTGYKDNTESPGCLIVLIGIILMVACAGGLLIAVMYFE